MVCACRSAPPDQPLGGPTAKTIVCWPESRRAPSHVASSSEERASPRLSRSTSHAGVRARCRVTKVNNASSSRKATSFNAGVGRMRFQIQTCSRLEEIVAATLAHVSEGEVQAGYGKCSAGRNSYPGPATDLWDTTALNREWFRMPGLETNLRGIPHLAKNQRDVGHPASVGGPGPTNQHPEVIPGRCGRRLLARGPLACPPRRAQLRSWRHSPCRS